jgi:hypothetical protein
MHRLWLLVSIIIVLSVSISSNTLIIHSSNLTETRNNNNYNFTSLCRNSLISCLDDITYLDKDRKNNTKIQTDLILDQVNSTKLKEWIDTLSSFHTRNTKSDYIENVAYWLEDELQNLCKGGRVSFHNYIQNDQNQTFNLKNIICSKQGFASSSPSSSSSSSPHYNNTIIIGAHYDSRAENINNTDARAPGADDNASGVSALLELARILSHLNLKYNLEFVLFSGEEHGRWGSINYMKFLDDNNRTKTIDLYINLDMIGYRPSNETKNKVILEYDIGNKYVQNDKYSKNIALFIKKIASNYTDLEAELA